MIRFCLLSVFTFYSFLSFAQTETPEKALKNIDSHLINEKDIKIIGIGQSEYPDIYNEFIKYIETNLDLSLVYYCESHKIYVIEVSERFKDVMTLIAHLNEKFYGTDFLVKSENILRLDCKDEVLKQKLQK